MLFPGSLFGASPTLHKESPMPIQKSSECPAHQRACSHAGLLPLKFLPVRINLEISISLRVLTLPSLQGLSDIAMLSSASVAKKWKRSNGASWACGRFGVLLPLLRHPRIGPSRFLHVAYSTYIPNCHPFCISAISIASSCLNSVHEYTFLSVCVRFATCLVFQTWSC